MNDGKKVGQKYQNRFAYKVTNDQRKIEVNARAPLDRLCTRCMEQVKWKIQYGKYKALKTPAKCHKCMNKTVTKAYRAACDPCATKLKICSKCMEEKEIVPVEEKRRINRDGVDIDLLEEMEDNLKRMRERSRRKVLRLVQKGEVHYEQGEFVFIESGEPVPNLIYKDDFDEDYEDCSDDDSDDGDEDSDDPFGDSDDLDGDDDDDDNSKSKDPKTKDATAKTGKAVRAKKGLRTKKDAVAKKPDAPKETKENKVDKPATDANKEKKVSKEKTKKKNSDSDDDEDWNDSDDDN